MRAGAVARVAPTVVGRWVRLGGVTIHQDHPFATPPELREPLRRLRGQLAAPVTVWTCGELPRAYGWTVSSLMVADGNPAEVVGLLDRDTDFADALAEADRFSVNVLARGQQQLAEVFADLAPSPGGRFRTGEWIMTDWGPRLTDAVAWFGVRRDPEPGSSGWFWRVQGAIEAIEVPALPPEPLVHLRGQSRKPTIDSQGAR
ncbi:flavin reductase [Parenemella sanctibonifatiensis]|uniref:Flavin reductase n=1 Tax=Parenemella sanctibonifatiensis TaxID=2016505 RepID=A0A255EII4_9ACTN|nr:flavin reductase [Parenemella sanctibonifatiensis]